MWKTLSMDSAQITARQLDITNIVERPRWVRTTLRRYRCCPDRHPRLSHVHDEAPKNPAGSVGPSRRAWGGPGRGIFHGRYFRAREGDRGPAGEHGHSDLLKSSDGGRPHGEG